jgi:hypothetical protein
MEAKPHILALQAHNILAVEEVDREVLAVFTAKIRSQVVKNQMLVIVVALAVCMAAEEEVREPRQAAVMAHQEVYASSGVLAQTVLHDPFRTHTAPRNLQ